MKTIYKIKTYICTYVILIMTFVVLLCCSYYIPINKENMRESAELLYQEGVFPNYKENIKKISGQDNFTDSLMLNIISTMNENEDVLSAIMRMDYLQEQDGEFNSVDDLYDIYTINASNHIFEKVSYARYWHGYVVYLKPLMLIFNFHQLRIFMFVCIYSLLIICLYCIAQKIGIKYTIAFLAGFIIIDINNICYSVQYFNVFFVTLCMLIYISNLSDKKMFERFEIINFVFGGIVSFLDLLTTPIITYGLCSILFFMYWGICQNNNVRTLIAKIIKAGVMWGSGYAIIWATKWVVASIATRQNIILDALNQAEIRTSVVPDGFSLIDWIKYDYSSNWRFLFSNDMKIEIVLVGVVISIVMLLKFHIRPCKRNLCVLFLLLCVPYIWYIVLKNHSGIHAFFTYRNQIVSIICAFEIILYCIDERKLLQNIKNS